MATVTLGISVLLLVFGALYALFNPRWAILFIIVLYPLEQLLTTVSTFFSTNTKALNLLIGGLAVVGAASAFFSGRSPLRGYMNPLFVVTLLLYLFAIVGIGFAPEPHLGVAALSTGWPYLGLLLFFPALLLNDLDDFRRLVVPLMVVGSVIVLLILLSPNTQMFGGRLGIQGNTLEGRIQNPLATASLGGTIVIFGMLYRPAESVPIVNLIRAGAIVIGLVMALLSGSRGQLFGAVFCGVAMFPFARQIKNLPQFFTVAGTAGFGIVLVMLVLNFATTGDTGQRFSSESMSAGVGLRGEMAVALLSEWIGNPVAILQGLGTASFTTYWTQDDIPYVHNMPVEIMTENGLIGLALLLVMMGLTAKVAIELLRLYKDSPRELSTAAIMIAWCMYQLILSLKQGSWFVSAAPFWVFLILSKVHARSMADARDAAAWQAYEDQYAEYEAEQARAA